MPPIQRKSIICETIKAIWHIFRDSIKTGILPSADNEIPDTVLSDLAPHDLKDVYTKSSMF
jgi:hypothetical protein